MCRSLRGHAEPEGIHSLNEALTNPQKECLEYSIPLKWAMAAHRLVLVAERIGW